MHSVAPLDKEKIYIPGRTNGHGFKFQLTAQNSIRFSCLFLDFSMS